MFALPDEEATHLTRVLRLAAGAALRVFDGRGGEWMAVVEQVDKHAVVVRRGAAVTPAPESRLALTLVAAVLKGDKMDDVVRDAVMLGVAAIQPMIAARSEVPAAVLARRERVARWQRIAVASAKQCGRAVVPEVRPVLAFADALAATANPVMLVEPDRAPAAETTLAALTPAPLAGLLIGPEGGWTDEELRGGTDAGATLLTLGGATLRADAVPLVALTALRVRWGDLERRAGPADASAGPIVSDEGVVREGGW